MAKMTLLEIVSDILNDLDGDPVNSISDTVEAQQVAQIVKTTYNNLMDGRHWPHLDNIFQLEALGSTSKPNYMKIPETIINVDWIKYNTRKVTDTKDRYTHIEYKTPVDFLELVDVRNSADSTVQVVTDFSGRPINILNNKAPQYFTSFDDEYIIFDSFDSAVDNTVQASKSSAQGRRNVTFTISNGFIPDLPVQSFSMLLNEAKSTAFIILKQSANQKAEQHSITQRRRMSQDAWKLTGGISYPSYGRK
jgi:hypothetical protein